MALGDIVTGARNLMADALGQAYDATIQAEAVNWAQNHVCRVKQYTRKETSVAVSGNPLRLVVIPTDWISVLKVIPASGLALDFTTEDWLDRRGIVNWRTDATLLGASPKKWYWYDGATLGLVPPASGATNVTVIYIQKPTPQFASTDIDPASATALDGRIPLFQQPHIKYFIASWLLTVKNDKMSLEKAEEMLKIGMALINETPNVGRPINTFIRADFMPSRRQAAETGKE